MVYYIAEGLVRVLSDILVLCMIRSVINYFSYCQIQFWESVRHGELNIQDAIPLIRIG